MSLERDASDRLGTVEVVRERSEGVARRLPAREPAKAQQIIAVAGR
jgi:hypothetical protein